MADEPFNSQGIRGRNHVRSARAGAAAQPADGAACARCSQCIAAGVSLEEITTTRIAEEAGLSIGALYRFFPDKQSIIDAIAVRHVESFKAGSRTEAAEAGDSRRCRAKEVRSGTVLDAVVDAYIVYLDAHPDFRTISFGRHISPATKEREASPLSDCQAS